MTNTEWLKSLTDDQLVDEIEATKLLIAMGSHPEHHARELKQARAELKNRMKEGPK